MSKGDETRDRILDRAFRLAARDGLEGLSLSALATELGMSKSGLFAHFRSKEELQLQVLATARERFEAAVVVPAIKSPRGLPRLKKLFEGWMRWLNDPALPGGCIFIAASTELDDRPGKARDAVALGERQLRETIARIVASVVEEGAFARGVDCEQFAFELHAIILVYHHDKRLLRDGHPEVRARAAFLRLCTDAAR